MLYLPGHILRRSILYAPIHVPIEELLGFIVQITVPEILLECPNKAACPLNLRGDALWTIPFRHNRHPNVLALSSDACTNR